MRRILADKILKWPLHAYGDSLSRILSGGWGEVKGADTIFECLETMKFNLIPNILRYRTDVI